MESDIPVPLRHILADRKALEPVDAPFALLQVDRVGRQVPVYDPPAVIVEIQALLANGRRDEYKRAEWGVERIPDRLLPVRVGLLSLAFGKCDRKVRADVGRAVLLPVHTAPEALERIHIVLGRADIDRLQHLPVQLLYKHFVLVETA